MEMSLMRKTAMLGPPSGGQAQTVQQSPVFVLDRVSDPRADAGLDNIPTVLPAEQITDPRSVCETFGRSSGRSGTSFYSIGDLFLCPVVCQKASVGRSGSQQQMHRPQYFHAHSQMYKQ